MSRGALSAPPPGFDDLSTDEKLDYVQALWDRISSHPDSVSIPDWHHDILEDRLARHIASSGQGLTLEESLTQTNEKLRESRSRRK